ncbi:MAG: hypothetical protein KF730_03175 [Sphingomonas sp.]|uniref:putative quinol monooxygenase n=1 Tax=Sphingomonas sp. TaxID=28214 RepID=UPI0025E35389|nr:hypothetical protein [Sphingomonas sp.]MBX3563559.1 hypothetical protein [Sphingomonas sp.]
MASAAVPADMDRHAVWVTMEAIPGREDEARDFLESVAVRLRAETGTSGYMAVDLGGGRFGVFSTFRDDRALRDHAEGVGRWIEARRPGLFAAPYDVTRGQPFAVHPHQGSAIP